MACSDNTVRAGLTPKFRDVDTLCDMLDYSSGSALDNLFDGIQDPVCPYTVLYDPPVSDFAVRKIQVSRKLQFFIAIFIAFYHFMRL